MRRRRQQDNRERYRVVDIELDAGARQARRGSEVIELPRLSFDLFLELARAYPDALSIDELTERVWQGVVVTQATVAKRVELLRQALGDDSVDSRYVALVRGHGYRLVDARPAPTDRHHDRARLRALLASAALCAVAFALWLAAGVDRGPSPGWRAPAHSIAVLPFTAMSDQDEDQLFADGLTEEISHRLASVKGLMVTGRTSSFYFKGRNEDVRTIGRALGVANVLEGAVRREGDRLRVTAQLIDTRNGFHRWSRAYVRKTSDVLAIQRDLAREVARQLQLAVPGKQFPPPSPAQGDAEPEGYESYLKALQLAKSLRSRRAGEAQRILEALVEREPAFAKAWSLLAQVHMARLLGDHEDYAYAPARAWEKIEHALAKAREYAPQMPQVQTSLGIVDWLHRKDAAAAADHFRRAIKTGSADLDVLAAVAGFARQVGRLREAANLEMRIVERDPLCAICYFRLAKTRRYQRRYEAAQTALRRFRLLSGGGAERTMGLVLLLAGEARPALESFRQLEHHTYLRRQGVAMALYALGRQAEADRALDRLIERDGRKHPLVVAAARAYRGERDAAFSWLDRLGGEGVQKLRTDFQEPVFDALRSDPRWNDLLARHGISRARLADLDFAIDGFGSQWASTGFRGVRME